MCTCSLIALWCPCETHEYEKQKPGPDSLHHFPRHEREGHIITKLINTGAYIWCDDFLESPTFANDFHSNPPQCPNNELKYEYPHFPSRAFCADCLGDACCTVQHKESKYGYAHAWERRAAKRAHNRKQAAAGKPAIKAEKDDENDVHRFITQRAATVPLRVIDLREDGEADVERSIASAAGPGGEREGGVGGVEGGDGRYAAVGSGGAA
ncbi:hypothetical protein C8A01DRAFT_32629 [Parachaetomium inaequale]|uniref:Uncharacterized protein n=1 Tax=Parachaetomium inaequale TaxID=2588326 RepID=A0AAN6SU86_9PEZI|nr:hypothetical protein C8A01DRAFT_32629 [Parachaetomium inaequale]